MDTLIERKKRFTPKQIYGGVGVLFILVLILYFIFRDTGSSMTFASLASGTPPVGSGCSVFSSSVVLFSFFVSFVSFVLLSSLISSYHVLSMRTLERCTAAVEAAFPRLNSRRPLASSEPVI